MAQLLLIAPRARETTALVDQLRLAGHHVDRIDEARDGFEHALHETPDLLVVDTQLPDMSGSELIRLVRSSPMIRRVPLIMIGASASEIDRVVAFEVGADDYVTKPFSVRELVLRVRAVLRRRRPARPAPASALRVGLLGIDPATQRATVAGNEIELSSKELRLLLALHRERGRVRSRGELLAEVWGTRGDVSTRTVDACVRRLRAKLGVASNCVHTVRGVGYRLLNADEVTQES